MKYTIIVIAKSEEGKTLQYEKETESDNGLFVNLEIVNFKDISGMLFEPKHIIEITSKIKEHIHSCLAGWIEDGKSEIVKTDK